MAELLAKRSKELGRSQSDLVRAALEAQFAAQGGQTCHDLMRDVCGSIRGPADLSSNRKHLARFGE